MATAENNTYIDRVRLLGQSEGAVARLAGFRKGRHSLPEADTVATRRFLGQLCADTLAAEAEAFFQNARRRLAYRRKEISLELSPPQAVLTSKDFSYEWSYGFDPADARTWILTRTLSELKNGELLRTPGFDALFAEAFTSIAFDLRKGVQVEAVIDAIESMPDGHSPQALRVDYPSDCRFCTLSVPEVDATVVCDGASLEIRFPKSGSPLALLEAFESIRSAFSLSQHATLAALL